jgi:hypothetical protein
MSMQSKDNAGADQVHGSAARATPGAMSPQPTMLGAAAAQLGAGVLQRKLRDRMLQRKAADTANDGQATLAAGAAQAPTSGGAKLPDALSAQMGTSMGADFSAVRVHEGEHVREVGAQAYASGNDLHFAPGEYQPESASGRELIGHELAHVQQQQQGRVSATTQARGVAVNDDGGLEREADERGAKAARGEPAGGSSSAGAGGKATAGPVQYKLKLVAGYTEAINWSAEARALIEAYDKLVELHDQLAKGSVGAAYRRFRKNRLRPLTAYRTTLEATTIPNNHDVRVAKTQEVEIWIAKATDDHTEMERIAGTRKTPQAAVDVDAAPGTGEHTIKEHHAQEYEGTHEAGGLIPRAVPPKDASAPAQATSTPAPTLGAASSNSTTPATAPEAEAAAEPEAKPPSVAQQMVEAVEIKLFDTPAWLGQKLQQRGLLAGDKLAYENKGRAGEMSANVKGGLSSSAAEGGTVKHELTGKVSLIVGKTAKFTSEPLDVLSLGRGHRAQLAGAIEGTAGMKTEGSMAHSASYSREKGVSTSLKGSASAFAGGSIEITPQIRIVNAAGEPITAVTATGGLAYGIGGAYEGVIALEGYKLKFSSKGKLAAGLGVSWGMSAEIDVGSIVYNLFYG